MQTFRPVLQNFSLQLDQKFICSYEPTKINYVHCVRMEHVLRAQALKPLQTMLTFPILELKWYKFLYDSFDNNNDNTNSK